MVADPQRVQADRLGVLAKGAYLRPGGHLAGPVGHSHGHDDADPHATKSRPEEPACYRRPYVAPDELVEAHERASDQREGEEPPGVPIRLSS